ncbi:MAG: hypothetical protein R3E35_14780 [Rhodocyclaceae bacterium]
MRLQPESSSLPSASAAPLAARLLLSAGGIMALIVAMLAWSGFALKDAALSRPAWPRPLRR